MAINDAQKLPIIIYHAPTPTIQVNQEVGMSKYQNYGNVKMRGKKEMMLPCGCCDAINKKKLPICTEKDLQRLEQSARIYKPNKHYPEIPNDE